MVRMVKGFYIQSLQLAVEISYNSWTRQINIRHIYHVQIAPEKLSTNVYELVTATQYRNYLRGLGLLPRKKNKKIERRVDLHWAKSIRSKTQFEEYFTYDDQEWKD